MLISFKEEACGLLTLVTKLLDQVFNIPLRCREDLVAPYVKQSGFELIRESLYDYFISRIYIPFVKLLQSFLAITHRESY